MDKENPPVDNTDSQMLNQQFPRIDMKSDNPTPTSSSSSSSSCYKGLDAFHGSSICSLAPRDSYVTYAEVRGADSDFFKLVECGHLQKTRQLIHAYNGRYFYWK